MALADQNYHLKQTEITAAGEPVTHEADFSIIEKQQTPEVPFTLDDITAAVAFLKTQKGIPGTARVGNEVVFALRY